MKITLNIILLIFALSFLTQPAYAQDTAVYKSNGTIEDYNGNIYHWVKIGRQKWLTENLRSTHYASGEPIPLIEANLSWDTLHRWDQAYCFYDTSRTLDNKMYTKDVFGALYTWSAATKGQDTDSLNLTGIQGVCPTGWHIPTDIEWEELAFFASIKDGNIEIVNGEDFAGMRLKATGNITDGNGVWPKEEAHYGTNETGFSGVPGGFRSHNGGFYSIGGYGCWWSSVRLNSGEGFIWILNTDNNIIERKSLLTNCGASVRCVSY